MDDYMKKVIKLVDLSQNMPLNQIVYNGLRDAIISGIIPVGERINEKKYSMELNVSRTPIREALYRMQSEGIIEHIPNYGFVIRKVSVEDAEEIYKLRVALDTLASINAMQLMTENDFKEMKLLLDKTEESEENADIANVINLFYEFNEMIYTYSNMPILRSIIHNLRNYLKWGRHGKVGCAARSWRPWPTTAIFWTRRPRSSFWHSHRRCSSPAR